MSIGAQRSSARFLISTNMICQIEHHYARALAILEAGSEFAVVGDVEAGELRVFRMSGMTLGNGPKS